MWLDRQAAIQAPGRNPHNMGSQEGRDRGRTGAGQGQEGRDRDRDRQASLLLD